MVVISARCRISPVLLVLICAGCASVAPEPASVPAVEEPVVQQAMRDLTGAEKSILADAFTAGLAEPKSAKFRWTKVPKTLPAIAFDYCGLVNQKNAAGFTGMKPFLATIRTENGNIVGGAIAALDNENRDENRDVIPRLCRQKGLNPLDAR